MQHLNVTNYMRKAIAAYSNKKVDFKIDIFANATYDDLHSGRLSNDVFNTITKIKGEGDEESDTNYPAKSCDIIIAFKTIRTHFDGQEQINSDIDALTGVYFIPAKLDTSNMLSFDINRIPWIPRDFLEPMTESILSFGKQTDYDALQSDFIGRKHQVKSWNEFLTFSIDFFDDFMKLNTNKEKLNDLEFEKEVYIFKDNSVISTMHILPFYDFLVKEETVNKLYDNFISLDTRPNKHLIEENKRAFMKHMGQMNRIFPLNASQRECVTHFQETQNGDILAVNGPPGTGKTTLLQSILANMLVDHAIEQKDAPIVLGTSSNNQAVKNIIASFANTESKDASSFENRWILGVKSLALYMPSTSKIEEEQRSGVQVDNNFGQYFNNKVDCDDNIEQSKVLFLKNFEEHFGVTAGQVGTAIERIHEQLTKTEILKKDYLELIEKLSIEKVIPHDLDNVLQNLNQQIESKKLCYQNYKDRIKSWEIFFANLPWWMRLLEFIKPIKQKIQNKCSREILVDEVFIKSTMHFFEIESVYSKLLDQLREEIETIDNKGKAIFALKAESDRIQKQAKSNKLDLNFETFDMEQANISLDISLRYHQFWLAVHYHEGKWLLNESPLDPKVSKTNYSFAIRQKMKRWAMITPFFVSTLYMLPSHFSGYLRDTKNRDYLIDFIDLMIIDEAGQVSPEIATCSFALAKKALIVGDEKQIEPVYSISKALDRALAVDEQVVHESLQNVHSFLNCSESSVMRVASNRCDFEKYEEKGLFLSEHRRCYDEIIEYCNKLMYHGHLKPKRGSFKINSGKSKDPYNKIGPMMHIHVPTDRSTKSGNSRTNYNEANTIAEWIQVNFSTLKLSYQDTHEKELIAVITPFKAQVGQIKRSIKKFAPTYADKISVGTVHTFQGAERPIIIFSTVYGSQDGGCYFIDANPSMLNVAVSRAKDAFITVGDIGCLSDNPRTPSGLLKEFLRTPNI